MSAEGLNTDSLVAPVAVSETSTASASEVAQYSTNQSTVVPARSTPEAKSKASTQKIRDENRERKKRWREANEDRNKDNDLRCRVNKRATRLHGKEPSEKKTRWMEEEFAKRQAKRKEKERKRIQLPSGEMSDTAANTSVSLSEHLAIHGVNGVTSTHQEVQHQQLQATAAALNPAASQFDPNTVKTALALNDLVKKNGGAHLDLASLLSDPNLARQLLELEASSAAAAAAATQPPAAMVIMNTTPKSDPEAVKTSHMLDTDYPMDAVLTLMQLNGSWKA